MSPGWDAGTGGGSGLGGLSDGQRPPHAVPALGILQAAGRPAPTPRVPTTERVVIGLPGA